MGKVFAVTSSNIKFKMALCQQTRGHGGARVTLWPPISEIGVPVYQFTVHNLDQLYVLISSALPTTSHNFTDRVLSVM